jgi:aryl-alcohol dehydrogenase-like predicted oxidoreductase
MRYKLLGRSGLRVSELCLGTMTFGEEWGWGSSKDESRAVFSAFAEAGGNFLDTADFYTAGTSEKLLGEFIGRDRDRFVVATKYTSHRRKGDPNGCGNHRKSFFEALHASLRRLNTDYVDLYWLHAWDGLTPVEEVMRAFDDAVRMGKVHYAGISDAPAWVVSQANTLALLRGWTPFVGLQIEYSLIQRTPERDLLPMARAFEIGATAWSPLASGLLSGKYGKAAAPGEEKRLDKAQFVQQTERNLAIAKAVDGVAAALGKTSSQVALNWVRQRDVIPIFGARKLSQFRDNLGCLSFTLPAEQIEKLDAASQIDLGFPHDFLASEMVRDVMFGGTWGMIDRSRTV